MRVTPLSGSIKRRKQGCENTNIKKVKAAKIRTPLNSSLTCYEVTSDAPCAHYLPFLFTSAARLRAMLAPSAKRIPLPLDSLQVGRETRTIKVKAEKTEVWV